MRSVPQTGPQATVRRDRGRSTALLLMVAVGVALFVGAAVAWASNVPAPTDAGVLTTASAGASSSAGAGTVRPGTGPARPGTGPARQRHSSGVGSTSVTATGSLPTVVVSPRSHSPGSAGSALPPGRTVRSSLPPADTGIPVVLTLPSLRVTAVVQSVSSADGVLAVPEDPAQVGWWSSGARPGAARGSTVIDGHIDSAVLGEGALFRLAELEPGDPVEVRTTTGTVVRYQVQARRVYEKGQGLAAEVFDQEVAPRLVLISCGGPFDSEARSYLDNIVVYAIPVR